LTRQQAIDWCVVGPTARASGVNMDIRRDEPYGALLLNSIDWNVITEKEGDVFAKTVIRILEMQESVSIIRQCWTSCRRAKSTPISRIYRRVKG